MANLFQFSPEIAANHKFFNLFLIGTNIFTAYFLVKLWASRSIGKIVIPILFFFLTLSGVIDLFPILNDRYIELKDYPSDPTTSFIIKNTPKNSVFLNSSYLYDPASMAGRKIYMGWPYFSWSAGYDTNKRHEEMRQMFLLVSKNSLCRKLAEENIDYIEIKTPSSLEDVSVNPIFFKQNFLQVFSSTQENFIIYETKQSCSKYL